MPNLISALGLVVAVAAGSPDVQAVVAANNQFAVDLYGQLRGREGNLFFSPSSVHKTLALAAAGARGDTAREMADVLHLTLGPDRQHRAYLETRKLLNRPAGLPGLGNSLRRDPQLYLAARLWGQRG